MVNYFRARIMQTLKKYYCRSLPTKVQASLTSAVNLFKLNRALSETALTELHRKVSVQKRKSAT
jgi:hypothetical protein